MRRAVMIAGAALMFGAPALAQDVTVEKRTTITREVPEPPASGSTVPTVIVAPHPPPPPRAEIPPPPPAPAMVWLEGHWGWNPATGAYVWVDGRYAAAPRAHAAWIPGHWVQRPDGWIWDDGRWD